MELEQIMTALRNAHNAGDTEAARRLAQMAQRVRDGQAEVSPETQQAMGQLSEMSRNPTMANSRQDRSLAYRIGDNLIGYDDGVMSPGEKLATALNVGGESMTLGLVGDELAAAADAAIGRGSYDERLQHHRRNEAQFREENPGLAFAAEVAPAFLPGAGGLKAAQAMTMRLGRVATGGLLGAGAGATYGFMEGEGGIEDRVDNASVSAALGGLFGAAAPKVIDSLSSIPRGVRNLFTRSQQRPTVEALRATKNAAYQAVDEAGEIFSGDDMTGLFSRVRGVFDDSNYVEDVDNAARATLRLLERRQGEPTTLGQLDRIRQNLWRRFQSAGDQPQILDAIGAIDDLIDQRAGASDLMALARAANARYAKSQLLENALTQAQDQVASTGSGGNVLNKMRQAVTRIINNPREARFFSGDEIDMMRRFVRGSTGENVNRLIGKLSPTGNGLMMALHIIGGVGTSGATVPLMGVGAGAKALADRSVQRGYGALQDVMAGVRTAAPQVPQMNALQAGAVTATAPLAEDAALPTRNALSQILRGSP